MWNTWAAEKEKSPVTVGGKRKEKKKSFFRRKIGQLSQWIFFLRSGCSALTLDSFQTRQISQSSQFSPPLPVHPPLRSPFPTTHDPNVAESAKPGSGLQYSGIRLLQGSCLVSPKTGKCCQVEMNVQLRQRNSYGFSAFTVRVVCIELAPTMSCCWQIWVWTFGNSRLSKCIFPEFWDGIDGSLTSWPPGVSQNLDYSFPVYQVLPCTPVGLTKRKGQNDN